LLSGRGRGAPAYPWCWASCPRWLRLGGSLVLSRPGLFIPRLCVLMQPLPGIPDPFYVVPLGRRDIRPGLFFPANSSWLRTFLPVSYTFFFLRVFDLLTIWDVSPLPASWPTPSGLSPPQFFFWPPRFYLFFPLPRTLSPPSPPIPLLACSSAALVANGGAPGPAVGP